VRRGCISLGNIKCDHCHHTILYPGRYLSLDEEKGKSQTLCLACCQRKGLVKKGSAKEAAEINFDLSSE
jgi:hypothetical protein